MAPKAAAIYVQAGAFAQQANAVALGERLTRLGVADAFVRRDDTGGRTVFRVRIGPIADVAQYDALVARLRGMGHTDVRLAAD